jgi:signal recognition particle subunit SRP54
MFESLSERFGSFFRNLSGRGTISESNVRDSLEEVRTALLEADVHQDVVRDFLDRVLKQAVGREVTKSIKPGQEMVGIVHEELVNLMRGEGPEGEPLMLVEPGPTVVMLCGLQGSGKTTTAGKLAAWLKRRGQSVMVAAADLQRPAAVEQLRQVVDTVRDEGAGGSRVAFYGEPERCAEYGQAVGVAIGVCQRALKAAREGKYDVLILDTAGRLHVNDELMRELQGVKTALNPHQILLVVDAMTGQDALRSAKTFHERLAVDGLILSKYDSDSRGGAALSARSVTGAKVRFVGTGEKFADLEEFKAERIAGRILGMGDVVSLVEKARQEVSDAEAERIAEKMAKGKLTLDDFLGQLRSIRRMGPLKSLMGMLPGVGPMLKGLSIEDEQLDRIEGVVHSMTPRERETPGVIEKSRARRIATGSGSKTAEVSRLVEQFQLMQKFTQQLAGGGMGARLKAMQEQIARGGAAALGPGGVPRGMPGMSFKGSSATVSPKAKFKERKRK